MMVTEAPGWRSGWRTETLLAAVLLAINVVACQSANDQSADAQTGSTDKGSHSRFSFSEDDTSLTILDHEQPVLSILHGRIEPPDGVATSWWRSNYVHPLYGLDGEILTEDFPADHLHHRGLFWTWPDVTVGDRAVDPWALEGARQLFLDWRERVADEDRATVSFRSGWRLDEGWSPVVEEQISLTVYPADDIGRSIDIEMQFTNVSSEVITLRGRGETGYGGFNIRPDGNSPGTRITTAAGDMEEDALVVESGWADYSAQFKNGSDTIETGESSVTAVAGSGAGPAGATQNGVPGPSGSDRDIQNQSGSDEKSADTDLSTDGDSYSGVAIFQHPSNPGFPHSGWILRHYGFIGASWPQYDRLELEPGESFSLSYRVYIHRGDAERGKVAERFNAYVQEMR